MIVLHKRQILYALSIVAISIITVSWLRNGDGSDFLLSQKRNEEEKWGRFRFDTFTK